MTLHVEWDENKAALNLKKHGVAFDEAAGVFLDSDRIDRYDARENYGEDRFITVGLVDARPLAVAYTLRGPTIRIISARKATSHEQRNYWKNR